MAPLFATILPLVPLFVWCVINWWSLTSGEGQHLLRVHVSMLGRLKMIILPFLAGWIVIAVLQMSDVFHWWALPVLATGYTVALVIPLSYHLTTVGIRLGHGPFRRWTEFSGVRRSRSGATLQGGPRAASYPVFLSGNREDDEFVLTLKTLVRDSYKGKTIEPEQLSLSTD